MNDRLYRESQKMAKSGTILDYPVTEIVVDGDANYAALKVTVKDTLPSFEKDNFLEEFAKEVPFINVKIISDTEIEIKGSLQQSVNKLWQLGYISKATHDVICDDFKIGTSDTVPRPIPRPCKYPY